MKRILAYLLLFIVPTLTFAREKGIDQKIDESFEEYTGGFVGLIFETIDFTDESWETNLVLNGDSLSEGILGDQSFILKSSISGDSLPLVSINLEAAKEHNYQFELIDDHGNVVETIVSGKDVEAKFENQLIKGNYTLKVSSLIMIPWVLFVLVGGALFFTFYFKFINFTGFMTAINIVRGKYDDLEEGGHVEVSDTVHTVDGDEVDTIRLEGEHEGEVSHFQALTAALSATVGLGNIAGVAVALSVGGPGATFWMIIAGLIGMASKFTECTLGVKYREIDEKGRVFGGPMYYLKKGLANKGFAGLGKVLAVIFAIMCIGGSFGGGNMFQANQALSMLEAVNQTEVTSETNLNELVGEQVLYTFTEINEEGVNEEVTLPMDVESVESGMVHMLSGEEKFDVSETDFIGNAVVSPLSGSGFMIGVIMAILVGVVIIGGIKSIAKVTDKIVPFMVGIYVLAAIIILVTYASKIPAAFGVIMSGAFSAEGIAGGFLGVLIQGFQRAAFSNEAGIGSASIAHSAVKTKNPASEGLVALLEPFIDTVLVCTMTALVLVITNMDGEIFTYGQKVAGGVSITSKAFGSVLSFFPYILTVAVVLFAFSSMISWSYYGYQAWSFLFGRSDMVGYVYKAIFCLFVIVGSASQLGAVIDFSDAMIFAMMVPNMIGLSILAPKVKEEYNKYMNKIRSRA